MYSSLRGKTRSTKKKRRSLDSKERKLEPIELNVEDIQMFHHIVPTVDISMNRHDVTLGIVCASCNSSSRSTTLSPRAAHMVFDSCDTAGSPRGWATRTIQRRRTSCPRLVRAKVTLSHSQPLTRGDLVPDRGESVRLMLGIGTRRRWRKGEAGQIGYARRWGNKQACNIFV